MSFSGLLELLLLFLLFFGSELLKKLLLVVPIEALVVVKLEAFIIMRPAEFVGLVHVQLARAHYLPFLVFTLPLSLRCILVEA